ncbi:peptide ABC transporter substrate-binding protein [Levilactobacillus tongjiangensis]|uniref:Peptide ABC transporter substrate-binding protein n=1 Tax=Levilactobacillus tongjiangensis TaxID=2486023 RepID=A0ABW1SQQ4_9LACO|nr:peptide ABC transporter substrate-binding protein [Levilactobacillus tongjiangensis]
MSQVSSRLRRLAVVATSATLMLTLAACGKKSDASHQDLVRTTNLSSNFSVSTLDISKSRGFYQTGNLFDTLLTVDKHHKVVAALATKHTVSKDGKTYTFTIRKGATFSNGDPINAQSFVYSWQRSLKPATKSMFPYIFKGIKNAMAINAGKLPASKLGAVAKDAQTLVITLDHPIAYFDKLMTYQAFSPQDKKLVDKYGKAYGTAPDKVVYSGPFKMSKWEPESKNWTFVKNDKYWDKDQVKLTKINLFYEPIPQTSLNLYQAKKLDFTILSSNQYKNFKGDKRLFAGPYSYMNYILYNQNSKDATLKRAFNNVNIRKAISLTLDRKQIVKDLFSGSALQPTGMVTNYLSYNAKNEDFGKLQDAGESVTHNPSIAKTYWKKGLAQLNVKTLKFSLLTSTDDASSKLAELVKASAEKQLSGLTISLQTVPDQIAYQRSTNGQYDAYIGGRGADIADPIEFLKPMLSSNPQNYGGWKNKQYDKLINDSTTDNLSATGRWNKLLQAEKLLADDQAETPLYQNYNYYLKDTKLHGMVHNSVGAQWIYKYMYMTK